MFPRRVAALGMLLLAGCPRTDGGDRTTTVVVALEGKPATLDPRFAIDAYSARVLALVFRGLTRIDAGGRPVPDLAKRWHYAGPLTLDIDLRPGQAFQDGSPIDASAVATGLEALRDPALASPLAGALQPVETIEVTGDLSLRLRLRTPFAPLLDGLQLPILHPAQATAATIENPIGSGLYRLLANPDPDTVRLRRMRSAPPRPDDILFRTIADPNARVFALETGAADLAQNSVPPHELGRLTSRGLLVRRHSGWNVSYLGLNHALDKFRDPRVREAIALAIDRDAILARLLFGAATKTDTLIPPGSWAYASPPPRPHDPERARALLSEAGYGPDGSLLSLEYKTSNHPERLRIAEAVAADLRAVGIDVRVRPLEFGVFFEDVKSGNFEMFSLTWVGVAEPDHLHYALHSASVPPAGGNRGRWADAELDELLDTARRDADPDARRNLYARAQTRIAATLPVIPLWVHDAVVVQSRRLSSFEPLPNGNYLPLADATLTP